MQILTTPTGSNADNTQSQAERPQEIPPAEQVQRFADLLKKKRMPEAMGVPVLPSLLLGEAGHASTTSGCLSSAQVALRTLAESLLMPASLKVQNTANELRITVLSGVLAGAEMLVAQVQGRLKMTLRAANEKQRKALESIQHKLQTQISSMYPMEKILIEQQHD
ncbi:hypothetical protein [Mycoavidus sp. SF9855]|uniref:hypothetical protein n=1 Tax=Mycoavidus sp. SF9855 TaxID=2968475 RepID=UPI00211C766B|nr:hypothetical protein [Mycoavidus sp. SF9855]UUM21714.1 hypothetical protein NQD60_00890 [Mycoavidus sp. SF9855]